MSVEALNAEQRIHAVAKLAVELQSAGRLITVRDVMARFGLKSPSTAHSWIRRTIAAGLLTEGQRLQHGQFRVRGQYACPCCGGSGVAADAAGVVQIREEVT